VPPVAEREVKTVVEGVARLLIVSVAVLFDTETFISETVPETGAAVCEDGLHASGIGAGAAVVAAAVMLEPFREVRP
jgi:hypothetical protein